MEADIPSQMRAVQLQAYHDNLADAIRSLRVVEQPVPRPGRGQVLVKIEAAPCNPSDLLFLQGKYGVLKKLPSVPGWEGAGTVVASGKGWLARGLKNKRVACAAQDDRDGTWAEYFLADATGCFPLKRQIDLEAAASLIVNPLTALGLLDTARHGRHRAAVQTGAASQLGRMLLAMAARDGYPLICVVRRTEQVELLRSLGATVVLNSTDADFVEQLATACQRLKATVAFDAVAGEMTGILLSAMPIGACVYVYGALSDEACSGVDPIELIFQKKRVAGFYLREWLQSRGTIGVIRAGNRVQQMVIEGQIQTFVQQRVDLEGIVEGLRQYVDNMTEGKLLILPHMLNNN